MIKKFTSNEIIDRVGVLLSQISIFMLSSIIVDLLLSYKVLAALAWISEILIPHPKSANGTYILRLGSQIV